MWNFRPIRSFLAPQCYRTCTCLVTYACAFAVIHNNLDAAMEAANITGSDGTLNGQAKSAARPASDSTKWRFFGRLLTCGITPTLT